MTLDFAWLSIGLIILNIVATDRGLNSDLLFNQYRFHVGDILDKKQYYRLATSAFLHTGPWNLVFNMISLAVVGFAVESVSGWLFLAIVYFLGLICGNLTALFFNRDQKDYSTVGSSGGICAVLSVTIFLFPQSTLGILFLPIEAPGWVLALIFLVIATYAVYDNSKNVGHETLMGSTFLGTILVFLFYPDALLENFHLLFGVVVITLFAVATQTNTNIRFLKIFNLGIGKKRRKETGSKKSKPSKNGFGNHSKSAPRKPHKGPAKVLHLSRKVICRIQLFDSIALCIHGEISPGILQKCTSIARTNNLTEGKISLIQTEASTFLEFSDNFDQESRQLFEKILIKKIRQSL